jgi:hypothetical protein
MIKGQELIERTNSPTLCRRSTNNGSFSTNMQRSIFHSFSVWYNYCDVLSSETAKDHLENRHRPPGEPPRTNIGPWTTVWEILPTLSQV